MNGGRMLIGGVARGKAGGDLPWGAFSVGSRLLGGKKGSTVLPPGLFRLSHSKQMGGTDRNGYKFNIPVSRLTLASNTTGYYMAAATVE